MKTYVGHMMPNAGLCVLICCSPTRANPSCDRLAFLAPSAPTPQLLENKGRPTQLGAAISSLVMVAQIRSKPSGHAAGAI
jgi:hypothetical protein